jgi:hypothetical protein
MPTMSSRNRSLFRIISLSLLSLTTGGCASLIVTDTKPLAASRLEPPGSERIA